MAFSDCVSAMKNTWFVGCGLVLGLCVAGCGTDTNVDGTGGSGAMGGAGGAGGTGGSFQPPSFGEWVKYEPEGAVCSDGSPYAFYVDFSETSDNIVVYFMGGGGCWDRRWCLYHDARSCRLWHGRGSKGLITALQTCLGRHGWISFAHDVF